MLDPTAWQRRALDRGKATAGLSYDQILKSIAVNARWQPRKVDWQKSYEYFDGIDDPYRTMDFMVDGRLHQATTASVLRIDQAEHDSAASSGRALLARLIADGVLVDSLNANAALRPWESYHQQYLLNGGTGRGDFAWQRDPMLTNTDTRVNAPSRFLTEYPIQGDMWNGTRSQSLINLPIPRMGNGEVFIGPRFWNFAGTGDSSYPMNRMLDDMTEALATIVRLHKSANTHPGMSPALFFGMRSPDWTALLNEALRDETGASAGTLRSHMIGSAYANGELRGEGYFRGVQWVERSIGYFPSRFALPGKYDVDPALWDFTIAGPSNALWRASATSRQRKYWIEGPSESTTADCVVDFTQIMNLLQYFVNLPPQVTLHSAMYFHNFLFRTSYQQTDVPYGTAFAQYRQKLSAEYAATSQATALEKAASGFDMSGTPVSLEGQTVKSLAVAIAAVALGGPIGATAGVLAVGLMAIGAIIEELSRAPYVYNPDPGKSILRDQYRGGLNTNFWRYYTPDTVINSRPCIVYQ